MVAYKEIFHIEATETTSVASRLQQYLKAYDFIEQPVDDHHLIFTKKFSFLQGWRFNPLDWESRLEIFIENDHRLIIDYQVESNGTRL